VDGLTGSMTGAGVRSGAVSVLGAEMELGGVESSNPGAEGGAAVISESSIPGAELIGVSDGSTVVVGGRSGRLLRSGSAAGVVGLSGGIVGSLTAHDGAGGGVEVSVLPLLGSGGGAINYRYN
jgi:hypothetical protein